MQRLNTEWPLIMQRWYDGSAVMLPTTPLPSDECLPLAAHRFPSPSSTAVRVGGGRIVNLLTTNCSWETQKAKMSSNERHIEGTSINSLRPRPFFLLGLPNTEFPGTEGEAGRGAIGGLGEGVLLQALYKHTTIPTFSISRGSRCECVTQSRQSADNLWPQASHGEQHWIRCQSECSW